MDLSFSLSPMVGLCLITFFSYGGCILFQRVAGATGLILFQSLSILIANIQAMKTICVPFLPNPVAMGTEIMMVSFFASDLLCEHYGEKKAKQGILLGFLSYSLFTLILFTTTKTPVSGDELSFFVKSHQAMNHLFTPAPAFLVASITAFAFSQIVDIWIFARLKKSDGELRLGFRAFLSTSVGSFLDSTIFALLAWVVFAPTPLPLSVVFASYIGGTFAIRLILSIIQIPLMHMIHRQQANKIDQ